MPMLSRLRAECYRPARTRPFGTLTTGPEGTQRASSFAGRPKFVCARRPIMLRARHPKSGVTAPGLGHPPRPAPELALWLAESR